MDLGGGYNKRNASDAVILGGRKLPDESEQEVMDIIVGSSSCGTCVPLLLPEFEADVFRSFLRRLLGICMVSIVVGAVVASFASWSALSLPTIPTCALTHVMATKAAPTCPSSFEPSVNISVLVLLVLTVLNLLLGLFHGCSVQIEVGAG
ncbi:hypothetical protein CEXT_272051 [Caerostris extrusa]|uniref:Uncharacterized protein n=1 Tax=Caerostris extrusa TaxID=172846 RepID=A0AAV4NYR7_CAEEX|nr:hypothetical protein CEXT_272051 [Caerostris extrusa]